MNGVHDHPLLTAHDIRELTAAVRMLSSNIALQLVPIEHKVLEEIRGMRRDMTQLLEMFVAKIGNGRDEITAVTEREP